MSRHFPIIIEQDSDNIFIVECPVLKGCRSYGETLDEAINNIKEAILLCVEDSLDTDSEANLFIGIRDLELAI